MSHLFINPRQRKIGYSLFACLIFSVLVVSNAIAATSPTAPQITLDTTDTSPAQPLVANTITVNAGGDFQAALNSAKLGDTIILQAGATFVGPFTLPNKTSGSGWIKIQSSAINQLPAPGNRVSPSHASKMPKITVRSGGGSAIETANNAHHYRFVGIEFKPESGHFVYNLITLGRGDQSASTLPEFIYFDRCYVHGEPSQGTRRGIAMDGRCIAVFDSHVSDFKERGADSQALWAYNSPGPIKIENNYLEAAGENVMFGGSDPQIPNMVPADITIRRNHFYKPLSWKGGPWVVKNLLEFKNAERILIEGNIFENNWPAAQVSGPLLISAWNQNGTAPWCLTRDITIRNNKFINVDQGVAVKGNPENGGGGSASGMAKTTRVAITNNLFEINGNGAVFRITTGPNNVIIDQNTIFCNDRITILDSWNGDKGTNLVFTNNIVTRGSYGVHGSACSEGTGCLDNYFPGSYSFTNNAVISGPAGSYPSGNHFPSNPSSVGFVDYGAKNYRLASSSPYKNAASNGKDIGADIDALEAALSGTGGNDDGGGGGDDGGGGGGTEVTKTPQNLRIVNANP